MKLLQKSGSLRINPLVQEDSGPRTRDRVLFELKMRGPQTAGDLAQRLGVTAMAVRQHLSALESDQLVSYQDERRRVGRPARVWRLCPRASGRFPDSHADLTVDLIETLREVYGEEGLDRLVDVRTQRQLEAYRRELPDAEAPLEERLVALVRLREREGYMPEWRRERDGFLFIENHCPICAAASSCQRFCRDELDLFRSVLGGDVRVERTEHILDGARRCAYRILPAG
jgi:predicted ArsR family transcriptional regulator